MRAGGAVDIKPMSRSEKRTAKEIAALRKAGGFAPVAESKMQIIM